MALATLDHPIHRYRRHGLAEGSAASTVFEIEDPAHGKQIRTARLDDDRPQGARFEAEDLVDHVGHPASVTGAEGVQSAGSAKVAPASEATAAMISAWSQAMR